MIAVLITVISAGGYIFLHLCNITRYKAFRSSIKKLNVNSIITGFISFNFCLLLYFLHLFIVVKLNFIDALSTTMGIYAAQDSNIVPLFASLSVILCVFVALSTNIIQKLFYFLISAWRNYFSENSYDNFWISTIIDAKYQLYLSLLKENDFEALALESMYREMLVSVTLSNGKVYIGSIKTLPNFTNEREYLNLLPVLSGYRDDQQNLILVTDYFQLVENYENTLEENSHADDDFDLVIKYEHIVSINLFDLEIYEANIDKLIEQQTSKNKHSAPTVVNFNFDDRFLKTLKDGIDLGKF